MLSTIMSLKWLSDGVGWNLLADAYRFLCGRWRTAGHLLLAHSFVSAVGNEFMYQQDNAFSHHQGCIAIVLE